MVEELPNQGGKRTVGRGIAVRGVAAFVKNETGRFVEDPTSVWGSQIVQESGERCGHLLILADGPDSLDSSGAGW